MRGKDRSILKLLLRGIIIIILGSYSYFVLDVDVKNQNIDINKAKKLGSTNWVVLTTSIIFVWTVLILIGRYVEKNRMIWRYKFENKIDVWKNTRSNEMRETNTHVDISNETDVHDKFIAIDYSFLKDILPYPKKTVDHLEFNSYQTDPLKLLIWYKYQQEIITEPVEKGDLTPYAIKNRPRNFNLEEFYYSYRIAMRNSISDRIAGKKSYRTKNLEELTSELICYRYRVYCKEWLDIPSVFYYLLPATLKKVENKNWWHAIKSHLANILASSNLSTAMMNSVGIFEYSLHLWKLYGYELKEVGRDFYAELGIQESVIQDIRSQLDNELFKWQEQYLVLISKQMNRYRFGRSIEQRVPGVTVGMLKRLEEYPLDDLTEDDTIDEITENDAIEVTEEELIQKLDEYIENEGIKVEEEDKEESEEIPIEEGEIETEDFVEETEEQLIRKLDVYIENRENKNAYVSQFNVK